MTQLSIKGKNEKHMQKKKKRLNEFEDTFNTIIDKLRLTYDRFGEYVCIELYYVFAHFQYMIIRNSS